MKGKNGFKVAALAASIALAMGSTTAMAATTAPAAGQLPGKGTVVIGAATAGAATGGVQTINISGNTVIDWGSGSTLNAAGTGGFNIGSGAALHFAGQTASGADAVLNIDSSGNASQIFGTLDDVGTVAGGVIHIFVANSNGVLVGSTGVVNGNVSLIANKLSSSASTAFGTDPNPVYSGAGGNVTVQKGASLGGTILVSGGGSVNLDLAAINGATALSAGLSSANAGGFASTNTNATLNITGAIGSGSIAGFSSAGTASNSGTLDLSATATYGIAGLFTNTGDLTLPFSTGTGSVHNIGKLTTPGGIFNGSLVNDGTYMAGGTVAIDGGDLVNNGTISYAGEVDVIDGSIVNKGLLGNVDRLNTTTDNHYKAGADYSITNSGTVTGSYQSMHITANLGGAGGTTGSFTNTGSFQLANSAGVTVDADNNVTLGGLFKLGDAPLSGTNALGSVSAAAQEGVLTLATPVASTSYTLLAAPKIKVLANIFGNNSAVSLQGGAKINGDYTIRIGGGVTVSGKYVNLKGVDSLTGAVLDANVILQGTIAANNVYFGRQEDGYVVSDVFVGPHGGVLATGTNPLVEFDFTGKVKAAPYFNDANFRYNDLPITVSNGQTLTLKLNPVAYQTDATAATAVNILVDGGVSLESALNAPSAALASSAAVGATDWANTHLVLQAAGNIATSGAFYWPGMVYLGTIADNSDGSAAPGTLGYGTIALGGTFNNVLPGDVSGGAGLHFITQNPLQMNGHSVTTNADSWINFGTDALTAAYASGAQGKGLFFGGVQGSGNVVNYGALDPSLFHTQAPSTAR